MVITSHFLCGPTTCCGVIVSSLKYEDRAQECRSDVIKNSFVQREYHVGMLTCLETDKPSILSRKHMSGVTHVSSKSGLIKKAHH